MKINKFPLKHVRWGQNTAFVVVESRSILYSIKIVCLQVDWLTGYNGIMIEHLRSGALWNILLRLHFHQLWVFRTVHHIVPPHMWVHHTVRNVGPPYLGFPFPVGPPPSYRRAIRSLHFPHLWVLYTENYIIPPHMWVLQTVRNLGSPNLRFPFRAGLLPSSLCNHCFQSY